VYLSWLLCSISCVSLMIDVLENRPLRLFLCRQFVGLCIGNFGCFVAGFLLWFQSSQVDLHSCLSFHGPHASATVIIAFLCDPPSVSEFVDYPVSWEFYRSRASNWVNNGHCWSPFPRRSESPSPGLFTRRSWPRFSASVGCGCLLALIVN